MRFVLVLPGVLTGPGRHGPLQSAGPIWERLAMGGRVVRLDPGAGLGPLSWLGIEGGDLALPQGPLSVVAFGSDPPPRATLAHVSLASVSEEGTVAALPPVAEPDVRQAIEAARRLETEDIHLVAGVSRDHGMVWLDGPVEIEATSLRMAVGRAYRDVLPVGEGEDPMRRLVEDSVEVLGRLDLNKRRLDDGLAPINFLWPWGFGQRPRVPNLALAFGSPFPVRTRSIRLIGLSRLAGLRPNRPGTLGRGVFPTLPVPGDPSLPDSGPMVVHIDGFRDAASAGREDESAAILRDLAEALLAPLLAPEARGARGLAVATDGAGTAGIALAWGTGEQGRGGLPFDERALEEERASRHALPNLVQAVFETRPGEGQA